jgi:uncharacterized protein YacL
MEVTWFIRGVRLLFVALCAYLGSHILPSFGGDRLSGAALGVLLALLCVALDVGLARISVRHFSHGVFGLLAGLFSAFLITRLGLLPLGYFEGEAGENLRNALEVCTYAALGFLGITLAVRADRDQFALLIPYVRFRRDASEGDPLLLDTNAVIDGRVPRLVASGFLTGRMVVPRMVLDDLQRLTDARDPVKADRGKRGLQVLSEMRQMRDLEVSMHPDASGDSETLDSRLITLARTLNARLLTNDENLAQVARLRGITVLVPNELARALQSELAVGDVVEVHLVKGGKEKHQAVGYLPDGTMVVVSQAAALLGQSVRVTVSGNTQTSAGRLVFGEVKG